MGESVNVKRMESKRDSSEKRIQTTNKIPAKDITQYSMQTLFKELQERNLSLFGRRTELIERLRKSKMNNPKENAGNLGKEHQQNNPVQTTKQNKVKVLEQKSSSKKKYRDTTEGSDTKKETDNQLKKRPKKQLEAKTNIHTKVDQKMN